MHADSATSRRAVAAGPVVVSRVEPATLPALIALLRAGEAERQPGDAAAQQRAALGVQASLARFDFTRSDSCWMLLAMRSGSPAGYACVVRIPKADGRIGFLFVDELYVRETFRRAGVARALLEHIEALARAQQLAGVRLLARPANEAAQRLYRAAGYASGATTFYEKLFP